MASGNSVTTTIDDPDWIKGGFQYYGAWGLGEPIPEHFGGSGTYSNVPGSQAVLFFSGTSITYYADLQGDLSLAKVSIDGQSASTVNLTSSTQKYSQPVWMKNFTDGDHQLVIEHAGPQLKNIMVDYVKIVSNTAPISGSAGPIASVVPSGATLIDSTDPQIVFSGVWRVETAGPYYNKSRQATQSPGASMQLTLNGTAIWYFSNMGPEYGSVQITVDDDNVGQGASAYSPYSLTQKLIWSQVDLSVGTHVVKVTHNDTSGKYVGVDFIQYVPSEGSSSNPGSGSGSSTGGDDTGQQHFNKKPAVGAIVGGALGGLALLVALLLCLFCWRRRRSRSHIPPSTTNAPTYSTTVFSPAKASSTLSVMTPTNLPSDIPLPLGQTIPRGYVMPNNPVSELYPNVIRAAGHNSGYIPPAQWAGSVGHHTGSPSPPPMMQNQSYIPEEEDRYVPNTAAEEYRDSIRASRVELYSPSIVAAGFSAPAGQPGPVAESKPIQPSSLARVASVAPSSPPAYDKK